ncbi:hypothetical protein Aab01nite_63720 [Paractinoplanes abujensis]|nr:hypothetical protein Aab01nite_63720 [Actinoplanes abujensis]
MPAAEEIPTRLGTSSWWTNCWSRSAALPNTRDLGLETIGLEPGSWLGVDDTMRVNDWLYAARSPPSARCGSGCWRGTDEGYGRQHRPRDDLEPVVAVRPALAGPAARDPVHPGALAA